MRIQTLNQNGVLLSLLALVVTTFTVGCGDGFNTKLKIKSDHLHSGMTFQEVTNSLVQLEVLFLTNFPAPDRVHWMPRLEHDMVVKVYNDNLTATRIAVRTPRHGWGWSDFCWIDFDAQGVIIGYTWMYPH